MRGARGAKGYLANFLAAEFPAFLADLRDEWDLTEEELPDIVEFSRNPKRALDKWPVLACDAVRKPSLRRVEYDGEVSDTIIYQGTYAMRVFAWVRDQEWDRTIDQRDDITTALSRFLVTFPTIGTLNEGALVQEETLVEDYSDVTPVKGDRFVAGSFVGFSLRVQEPLSWATTGPVASARVDPTYLLPHPALD